MKGCCILVSGLLLLVQVQGAWLSTKASKEDKLSGDISVYFKTSEDDNSIQPFWSDAEPIPIKATKTVGTQLVYTVGKRQVGDRLVATTADSKTYSTLQDVTLNLAYPQSGLGAIVTFAQVVVNQSSNIGKGYVVAGGIGQRFIHLVIEAHSTQYFTYNAQIYGV
ncbi:uncharacterized protein LOC129750164 [Uranotaenia lowii]|uniref:uncharacterized protein LOC129750164 n=1 Tax=Uranotaenia lowii TaxID=190385 RepID=UPI002478549F|nr:uncharacterized protein LOC129750164 [Uranotaenia lowii]